MNKELKEEIIVLHQLLNRLDYAERHLQDVKFDLEIEQNVQSKKKKPDYEKCKCYEAVIQRVYDEIINPIKNQIEKL